VEKRREKERSPAAEDNSREWWSNAHSTMTTAINQGRRRHYADATRKQEVLHSTEDHRHNQTKPWLGGIAHLTKTLGFAMRCVRKKRKGNHIDVDRKIEYREGSCLQPMAALMMVGFGRSSATTIEAIELACEFGVFTWVARALSSISYGRRVLDQVIVRGWYAGARRRAVTSLDLILGLTSRKCGRAST
jgi:hypothetical protein